MIILGNFNDNLMNRGGSRTVATSKMEQFVIIVNDWKPLIIITKGSILDVPAVLDLPLMKSFCENYGLKNLIKQPTCYKNPSNSIFQCTSVIKIGLSDSHKMTPMRKGFKKFQPRKIKYRPYKHFLN